MITENLEATPDNWVFFAVTYDGTVDCWFDDKESFERAWSSPEFKRLWEDDLTLFDRSGPIVSEGGVVNEYIMRWDARPDGRFITSAGPVRDR